MQRWGETFQIAWEVLAEPGNLAGRLASGRHHDRLAGTWREESLLLPVGSPPSRGGVWLWRGGSKHRAELDSWPHLFALQVYRAHKGPALESIHPTSATDPLFPPSELRFPLCEVELQELVLLPVYEMPVSDPQPQPVAQATGIFQR